MENQTITIVIDPHNLELSAPIHNYGNILAVIFFPERELNVEWIRYLISFLRQDLQD